MIRVQFARHLLNVYVCRHEIQWEIDLQSNSNNIIATCFNNNDSVAQAIINYIVVRFLHTKRTSLYISYLFSSRFKITIGP